MIASLFAVVRCAETTIHQQEKERENAHQQLAQQYQQVIDGIKRFELPLKVAHAFARVVRKYEGDKVTLNISRSRTQRRCRPCSPRVKSERRPVVSLRLPRLPRVPSHFAQE